MSLTLYVAKPSSVRFIGASPPSWMCALLLADKSVDHDLVELDFAAGEHRSPEMLERNPRGTIPVLVGDGIAVHETFAILEWIEWRYPGHLPDDPARARVLTRFHESSELKSAGMRALAYLMRTPKAERDAEHLRSDGEALAAELDRWESYCDQVEGPSLTGGDSPSLADIAVYPYVETLHHLGLPLARWPRLDAHRQWLAGRPAAASTRPKTWTERATVCPWPGLA